MYFFIGCFEVNIFASPYQRGTFEVRCLSASAGDVMVIVSSVMGSGPLLGEPVAAAELFPAVVLAPPTPPLTTPADSMGTAMMPNVA